MTPPVTAEETVKPNILSLLALLLLSIAAFWLVGCAEEGKIVNSAPADLKLTVNRLYTVVGGTVTLSADATDSDGDSLTYSWKARSGSGGSAGSFIPSTAKGASISWVAPGTPGPVTITMIVTDGFVKCLKTQNITVCVRFPSPIRESKTISNDGYVYIVTDAQPVRIGENYTVTISPGVTIVVGDAAGGFEVYGGIVAAGTPSHKARISGNTSLKNNVVNVSAWDMIDVTGPSAHGVFTNAEICGATIGIQADDGGSITLDSCDIYSNIDYGVLVQNSSSATIHSCKIWDNGTCIYVLDSEVDMRGSSIRYSSATGVELSASQTEKQVTIEDCEIANHYFDCIVIKDIATPTIHNCSIYSSGDVQDGGSYYAIRLFGYAGAGSIHAENNFWGVGNTTSEKIAKLIYDGNDTGAISATVSFYPWLDSHPMQ
jgi:hypothetical protein